MILIRRRSVAFALVGLSLVGCVSQPADRQRVAVPGPAPLATEVPPGGQIELVLPSGEAVVEAGPGDLVEFGMTIRCPVSKSRCRSAAARTTLTSSIKDNRIRFGVKNAPGSGAALTYQIRVPEDRALNIRMKYGDLSVDGHAQALAVTMTAGAIALDMPESAVGRVDLGARFGEAALSTPHGHREGRRPLLVGSRVEWDEGRGPHPVQARVRFGDIQLRLSR